MVSLVEMFLSFAPGHCDADQGMVVEIMPRIIKILSSSAWTGQVHHQFAKVVWTLEFNLIRTPLMCSSEARLPERDHL